MLTVRHIPQYQQEPEDWSRFLDKAAKGSVKATDVLSYAEMAYMVALTGDPTSPETLLVTDYNETLGGYFTSLAKPESPEQIADLVDSADWFACKFHGTLSPSEAADTYSALWSRGRTVSGRTLLNDALQLCHSSWSANWLLQVIDEEDSLDYNSLNVVAAMLQLVLTWNDDGR